MQSEHILRQMGSDRANLRNDRPLRGSELTHLGTSDAAWSGHTVRAFQVLAGGVGPSHAFVPITELGGTVDVMCMSGRGGDLIHADRYGAVDFAPAFATDLPAAIATVGRRGSPLLAAARAGLRPRRAPPAPRARRRMPADRPLSGAGRPRVAPPPKRRAAGRPLPCRPAAMRVLREPGDAPR